MTTLWGVVLTLLTLVAWVGQMITAISPRLAARLGVTEEEGAVDPVFHADGRAEAAWDALVLWTAPLAGVMLIAGYPWWPFFGLVGGGMYLYFAGRGIFQRAFMSRQGIAIGAPSNVRTAYLFLTLWGAAALATIAMAITELA